MDQDAFAARSQQRWEVATQNRIFEEEIMVVSVPQTRGEDFVVKEGEHPRSGTTVDKLTMLKGING